jgi:hypothetical protein
MYRYYKFFDDDLFFLLLQDLKIVQGCKDTPTTELIVTMLRLIIYRTY